jgi:hypothetical protein
MIYFIQPAGRQVVKIGYAQYVRARLVGLQTAHAEELVLLGVLSGTEAKERELHNRFSHLCVRGEWFRYTPEIQEFVFEHVVPYSASHQATDSELSPAAPLPEKAPVTVVVEQKPVPPISAPRKIERTRARPMPRSRQRHKPAPKRDADEFDAILRRLIREAPDAKFRRWFRALLHGDRASGPVPNAKVCDSGPLPNNGRRNGKGTPRK